MIEDFLILMSEEKHWKGCRFNPGETNQKRLEPLLDKGLEEYGIGKDDWIWMNFDWRWEWITIGSPPNFT